MTTNLALYTYLLQANRSLAKEMRASVIRSQTKNVHDNNTIAEAKNNEDEIINSTNNININNNSTASSNQNNGNKFVSQSTFFPGLHFLKLFTK